MKERRRKGWCSETVSWPEENKGEGTLAGLSNLQPLLTTVSCQDIFVQLKNKHKKAPPRLLGELLCFLLPDSHSVSTVQCGWSHACYGRVMNCDIKTSGLYDISDWIRSESSSLLSQEACWLSLIRIGGEWGLGIQNFPYPFCFDDYSPRVVVMLQLWAIQALGYLRMRNEQMFPVLFLYVIIHTVDNSFSSLLFISGSGDLFVLVCIPSVHGRHRFSWSSCLFL